MTRRTVPPQTPAGLVIALFDGTTKVAKICGIGRTQVWRWTQPKSKGGQGGRVPREHWPALRQHAAANDLDLPLHWLAPELEDVA